MDINATLIVQMLVFATFVWFTMKFVWPPLAKAMEARQDTIAEGLAAGERGKKELELAQHRVTDQLKQAKADALSIIEQANKRAASIIEEAKDDARQESSRIMQSANEQIQQQIIQAGDTLKKSVASLAVIGAEKILNKEIDANNKALVDKFIEEI